jgi:hypothetical protein
LELSEMIGYDRFRDATIRSSALLIHGSNLHFYGARLADCAIICNTQSACLAFVDHRGASPPFCTFKSDSQFSDASGSGAAAAAAKDVYVRRERREALPSSNPYTMVPLTSQSWANETRVHAIHGFLSEHEALALRRHATDCFSRSRVRGTLPPTESSSIGSASCPARSLLPLICEVEHRMSLLTGWTFDGTDEPLLLTQQNPGATDARLDGSRLHHDRINPAKQRRGVTILVYLSSNEDGHTIFPTLQSSQAAHPADEVAPSIVEDGRQLSSYASIVRSAFHRGVRSLGCQTCAQDASVPPSPAEEAEMEDVHRHAEAECVRAQTLTNRGLAVRPELGKALVFWHMLPDGQPDANVWHAGCLARSGNRFALQKFAASPPAARATPNRVESSSMPQTTTTTTTTMTTRRVGVSSAGVMEVDQAEVDDRLATAKARAMETMRRTFEW